MILSCSSLCFELPCYYYLDSIGSRCPLNFTSFQNTIIRLGAHFLLPFSSSAVHLLADKLKVCSLLLKDTLQEQNGGYILALIELTFAESEPLFKPFFPQLTLT